jgi:hypothetical protein
MPDNRYDSAACAESCRTSVSWSCVSSSSTSTPVNAAAFAIAAPIAAHSRGRQFGDREDDEFAHESEPPISRRKSQATHGPGGGTEDLRVGGQGLRSRSRAIRAAQSLHASRG